MQVKIPSSEIYLVFTRSGGKGGQNVNKVSSRVQLFWNLWNSSVLTEEEKSRVAQKLKNKINERGEVMVVVDSERSQIQNREIAGEKLHDLVSRALVVPKKRHATRPTLASKKRRVESKVKRSVVKKGRRPNIRGYE